MEREGEIITIQPLPITAYGCEILRVKCIPVETVEVAKDIIAKLKATMSPIRTGVGLAAPQINSNLSAFIMRNGYSDTIISVINPTMVKHSGALEAEEGCLSIPNTYGIVPDRYKEIEVIFYDENLKKQRMKFDRFAGNIFQHEFDHLQGILFPDHMTKVGREEIASKLAEIESGKIQTIYPMIFSPSVTESKTNS